MKDRELLDFVESQSIEDLEKNHSFLVLVAKSISKKLEGTSSK